MADRFMCFEFFVRLLANRNVDIAVVIPSDLDRYFAVVDGLLTHSGARTVVDFAIRPFVDAENQHQPATGPELPAGHPFAPNRHLLALARLEQVAMNAVLSVAGADFVVYTEQTTRAADGEQFVQ